MNKENNTGSKMEQSQKSIIERLDLQLLLAVIVFFVSGWAYLNKTICDFTGNEDINIQMNHILVHYILTTILVLCLFITYLKGLFVITNKPNDNKIKYFTLFMKTWFPSLLLCIIILSLSSTFPWWISFILFICIMYVCLFLSDFSLFHIISICILFTFMFPVFISAMSIVDKDIEIILDKEYYQIDEDVLVTISSKGYACEWKMVCLGKGNIYPYTHYDIRDNMIVLKPYTIKGGDNNRKITVGAISPASGLRNFFIYPFRKMMNLENVYLDEKDRNIGKKIYYVSTTVHIVS